MQIVCAPTGPARVALVLAGGAARGAYEVGVVQHILEDVARSLGRDIPIDILCGTSVGALNSCFLAAFSDDRRGRAARLRDIWLNLKMSDLVHPDPRSIWDFTRSLFGRVPSVEEDARRRGGILDPDGLERLIARACPFPRIDERIAAGDLYALTVSTTHVGTGRTVVFVQSRDPLPHWGRDPTIIARAVAIRDEHALASAAIPFLFPAVRIGGDFYCDGGLRQNVPLSPARRLGADGLIVVSPRVIDQTPPSLALVHAREQAFPGPLFLLGKALNALLLDRIDNDIDRLERINALLNAGCRRYGPGFIDAINEELGKQATDPETDTKGTLRTRPLATVLIRASTDIGRMATEFARSPGFKRRVHGILGSVMRRLAEGSLDADLLSYLLFDGEFADQLIELGRADARTRHAELCGFFEQMAGRPAAAATPAPSVAQ
jgi:NTE family protein